jgi:hypothetical protein
MHYFIMYHLHFIRTYSIYYVVLRCIYCTLSISLHIKCSILVAFIIVFFFIAISFDSLHRREIHTYIINKPLAYFLIS